MNDNRKFFPKKNGFETIASSKTERGVAVVRSNDLVDRSLKRGRFGECAAKGIRNLILAAQQLEVRKFETRAYSATNQGVST
jgi:hypothetical protein